MSVAIAPGATAFTRTPRSPSSEAKCFTSVAIAPFVAAYAASVPTTALAPRDETRTMLLPLHMIGSNYPHHAHQPLHPLAIDAAAFLVELKRPPPGAVERQLQMQLVDPTHQSQIVRLRHRLGAVDPRARDVQQFALPAHRYAFAGSFDHRPSIRRAHRPGLLAKKSRSTVNWPILA